MTNGATLIYNQYVKPFHRKYKNKIEDFAEALHEVIDIAGKEVSKEGSKTGTRLI